LDMGLSYSEFVLVEVDSQLVGFSRRRFKAPLVAPLLGPKQLTLPQADISP